MLSDDFINRLVDDLQPVRRRNIGRDVLVLGALSIAEMVVFFALGMMRPDMPEAIDQPSLWWKFASMAVIATIGGSIALLSFNPANSPHRGLRWLMGAVVLALAAGWGIDASQQGWPALLARVDWQSGLQCTYKMILLSIPMLIGLGILMRRGAPTDPGATALSAGVGAAAWGALLFVFACPVDDPLYIALWYSVGCGLTTVVARLILPPLTRW